MCGVWIDCGPLSGGVSGEIAPGVREGVSRTSSCAILDFVTECVCDKCLTETVECFNNILSFSFIVIFSIFFVNIKYMLH